MDEKKLLQPRLANGSSSTASRSTFGEAIPGGRSVGVPGNIRMMALAHREHGKLPWAKLFEPAIRLARDGFVVTKRLNFALARGDDEGSSVAALTAAGRALYFGADGKPLPVGTVVRNPALAAFLEQVAARGPDSFYVGPNAQAIAATVNGSSRNPVADERRRCRDLRRQGTPGGLRRISAPSHLQHGPALVGDDDHVRDPEAARTVRSCSARAELADQLAFVRGIDAAGLRRPRSISRRPGPCRRSGRGPDRPRLSGAPLGLDRP